ncbi:sugar transferase [Gammaproteobacteria bacterium]|nr:sugar transferase [Gammaproteobacteria bacterium]
MSKRLFDIFFSSIGLIFLSPIFLIFISLIYFQDKSNPFYKAPRVGKNEKIFIMIKLRSMIVNADKSKVDSTASDDMRITRVGMMIRAYKLDELTQLFNVLKGDMSLVGPRPNVQRDVDLYSETEKKLLSVKPGITDFSSIIFSDEGDILSGLDNPDIAYNQLIRPWKSRLGILYIENQSLLLDIYLILMTVMAIINKKRALNQISKKVESMSDNLELIEVCKRDKELVPSIPPGHDAIVASRE